MFNDQIQSDKTSSAEQGSVYEISKFHHPVNKLNGITEFVLKLLFYEDSQLLITYAD